MKLHIQLLFVLITSLAVTLNHASPPPPEVYWKRMLPHTAMPQVLHHLLPSDEDTKIFEDNAMTINIGDGISFDIGGDDGPSIKVSPFGYDYGKSDNTQLLHLANPDATLFFLEKDLHPGKKFMNNVHFTKSTTSMSTKSKFLPRQVSDTIPFSSTKLFEILNRFSIEPNSTKAEGIEKTIEFCEIPAIKGENKNCVTSLEAMVDFVTSSLGHNNVEVLVTEVFDRVKDIKQETIIGDGMEKVGSGDQAVVCHPKRYLYPVFFCHAMERSNTSSRTRVYMVPLVGVEGGGDHQMVRVKAVAVCHVDTSKWNPKHIAFSLLGVKPGTVPVCHFLPENHLVWVAK